MKHELLIDLVRKEPSAAPALLTECLGLDLPVHYEVGIESPDLNESKPGIYHADAVLSLRHNGKRGLAIVLEVQLGNDGKKRFTWPVYLAMVRHRLNCPVMLVVICRTKRMADWCSRPIDMGHPGWILHPLVIGPEQIPIITDPKKVAATPALGVLSALAHGAGPHGIQVAETLLEGLYQAARNRDEATVELYSHYMDSVLDELPALVRKHMETQMATKMEYRSAFARRYYAEGEAKGLAKAIIQVLEARGLTVPEEIGERILSCHDIRKLNTWVKRAATIDTVDDLVE